MDINDLYTSYDFWCVPDFTSRKFTPQFYHSIIDRITSKDENVFDVKDVGKSFEERTIRLVKVGSGDCNILLWSQMHGDESTATMAIADILNYFLLNSNKKNIIDLLQKVTLLFLPMLNPDGAVRFQRRTAQNIDINRDAIALVTPEARILNKLHNEYKPQFGYSLHDQELSTVYGTKEITALALLAPVIDYKNTDDPIRHRAKQLAAFWAENLKHYIPNKIARYDDSYEPRAFGDRIQSSGTSTVLVESGHFLGDDEKMFIRKLNAIGLIASFYAIASSEYEYSGIHEYETLPFNAYNAYDVIIKNIMIQHKNGTMTPADIAISYQVDTHSEYPAKLYDIGDLNNSIGIKEFDGKGKIISEELLVLENPFEWEKIFNVRL